MRKEEKQDGGATRNQRITSPKAYVRRLFTSLTIRKLSKALKKDKDSFQSPNLASARHISFYNGANDNLKHLKTKLTTLKKCFKGADC